MRPLFPTLLLVALMALTAAAVQASASPGPQRRELSRVERLEKWLDAVARHVPGTIDAPAREIAGWPDGHLEDVVEDVRELAAFLLRAHVRLQRTGQPSAPAHHHGRTLAVDDVQRLFGLTRDEAATGDVSRLAMRAVLLHTDITVRLDEYDRIVRPRPAVAPRLAMLVVDGRLQGVADRGPHWELARSLLDLLAPDSAQAERKRRWYVAAGAFMHSRGLLADLLPHAAKATDLFPADPEILLRAGILHESLASPPIQAAVRQLSKDGRTRAEVGSARTHWRQARTFFGLALLKDPNRLEARVRLGYTLQVIGDDDNAAAILQPVLAGDDERTLRYYAALFLGGIHARAGRPSDARAAYGRAATLFPRAQSPQLGLSSLARAGGDRTGATTALVDWLPSYHLDDLRDPWWLYFSTRMDYADKQLDDWRREVEPWSRP